MRGLRLRKGVAHESRRWVLKRVRKRKRRRYRRRIEERERERRKVSDLWKGCFLAEAGLGQDKSG